MRPEVFDITFVVTKPILVHVRGGDFAQPAVVPRVRLSLGKAKAKGMKRASPPSKGARERRWGLLGSLTAAQFPVR